MSGIPQRHGSVGVSGTSRAGASSLVPRTASSIRSGFTAPVSASSSLVPADTSRRLGEVSVSEMQQMRSPLAFAAAETDKYRDRDMAFPALDSLLTNQAGGYKVVDEPAQMPWVKTETVPIPDDVFDEYNQTVSVALTGIMPQLNRAWITVDNKMHMWNFRTGGEVLSLEQVEHAITAVGLVRPKPDCFIESVSHLLVLATPVEMIVLAVSFNADNDDFELYDAGLRVSVKGMTVDRIATCDATGRIFFSGSSDKTNVWEFTYSNQDSWFRGRCSKVCLSGGALANLLPSIGLPSVLGGHTESETIVALEVDATRDLLYSLSSTDTIRVYHLDKAAGGSLAVTYTRQDLRRGLSYVDSEAAAKVGNARLVRLHAITKEQSNDLVLTAITEYGTRLFFKATGLWGGRGMSGIQVSRVRYTAMFNPRTGHEYSGDKVRDASLIVDPAHYFAVTEYTYTEADPLSADNINGGSGGRSIERQGSKVLFSSMDCVGVLSNGPNIANVWSNMETFGYFTLNEYVNEIVPLTPQFKGASTPLGFNNELYGQYHNRIPEIAILTNAAIHIYRRQIPIHQVLLHGRSEIDQFYGVYGALELCANLLGVTIDASRFGPEVRAAALASFSDSALQPTLVSSVSATHHLHDVGSRTATTSAAQPTTSTNENAVVVSGRCTGLGAHLSRVLGKVWRSRIVRVGDNGSAALAISRGELETLQARLLSLADFLDQQRTEMPGIADHRPDNMLGKTSQHEEASLQAEHRYFDAFLKLLKACREAVSFLLLIAEETAPYQRIGGGLDSIVSFLSESAAQQLADMDFRAFVSTTEGAELARDLVNSLVNRTLAHGGSIDAITRVLSSRCETFCSVADVEIYRAMDAIRMATRFHEDNDFESKMQYLKESVSILKNAAGDLQMSRLREAMDCYVNVAFYRGAIEIAFAKAAAVDRANVAFGYIHDGRSPDDPRKAKYDERVKIYELIFSVLVGIDDKLANESSPADQAALGDLREEAYDICLASPDEAFHFALYDWFFSTGNGARLLDIDTPYVLPYLQSNAKTGLEIADMLWVYSQKRGDYVTAANVLFSLATKPTFTLSLAQRIEFLSRAAGYCNGATSAAVRQDLRGLAVRVQDSLDVATIQNDVMAAVRADPNFTEEKRAENIALLDGPLLTVSDLYNEFAAPLHYSEICLAIFQTSDHRRTEDITRCWSELVEQHVPEPGADTKTAYQQLADKVRHLGLQFQNAEFVFPLDYLVPLLESYSYEHVPDAPRGWVIETFLSANATPEALFNVLADTFERREPPFDETAAQRLLANDIAYLFTWWTTKARARVGGVMSAAFLDKLRPLLSPEDYQTLANRVR